MNNPRNNPKRTASYIGYEFTYRLSDELVSELPDQRADAFIEKLIRDYGKHWVLQESRCVPPVWL